MEFDAPHEFCPSSTTTRYRISNSYFFRSACFSTLLRLPGGISVPGLPAIVTVPGLVLVAGDTHATVERLNGADVRGRWSVACYWFRSTHTLLTCV